MLPAMTKLVLYGMVLLAGILVGCNRTGPRPAPPQVSPAGSRSAPAPRTYALPDDLCTAFDLTPFTEAYPGGKADKPYELTRIEDGNGGFSSCGATISFGLNVVVITLQADVYADANRARVSFDGLKGSDFRRYREPKEVPGLRDSAYSYFSEDLGPRLVVLHGNARVAAYAHSYKDLVKLPPDVLERLRRMTEYALDHM